MKRALSKAEGSVSAGKSNGETSVQGLAPGLRVHEWGLNPLFWSYVKLFARDVHRLDTLANIEDSHVLHGKVVHRAEVAGIIVHVKHGVTRTQGNFVKYILDDGTGLIPCTKFECNTVDKARFSRLSLDERYELGDLLIVQGKLKRYRGAREILIASARTPKDPNEEILQWLRSVELAKTVYEAPFQRGEYVDDDDIMRCIQYRPAGCCCGAAYAEGAGYCRCVAAPLALDPSFEFRDALVAHLSAKEASLGRGRHLEFQFARDVRDEPSLRKVAEDVVLKTASATNKTRGNGGGDGNGDGEGGQTSPRAYTESMMKAKVMELLRAVMASMCRDGALYFLDIACDVYVFLSRAKVLGPAVEDLCHQQGLSPSQEIEIVRGVQALAFFHHVPGARIRACAQRFKGRQIEDMSR